MKLTALFTARRGRNFIQALSAREARNFQFEFLRPTHSLFGYFNRLVDQYTKVLHPNKDMLEQLQLDAEPGARWRKREIAKRHAKWEKNKREREKKRQDDQEAERSTCTIVITKSLATHILTQLRSRRLTGTTKPSCRRSSSPPPMRPRNCLLR